MARFTRGLQARASALRRSGLFDWEAVAIAGSYPTFRRTDFTGNDPIVYIRRMARSRLATYNNLVRYGYSRDAIENYIISRYRRNGWLYADGTPNPFKMLEYFRDISIALGEYIPRAKHRGRGRGRGISKGDVEGQKRRARARSRRKSGRRETLEDYEIGRGR